MRTAAESVIAHEHVRDGHGAIVLRSGHGLNAVDDQGRRYVDATAAGWHCHVGYGRTEIAYAIAAQLQSIHAYDASGRLTSSAEVQLVQRLGRIAPLQDPVVRLVRTPEAAMRAALEAVDRYWAARIDQPPTLLVKRRPGLATSDPPARSTSSGREVSITDAGSLACLLRTRAREVAAVVDEPVVSLGVHAPERDYWRRVTALCAEFGIPLVVDERVTGFGRCGALFASSRFGVTPDILVFGSASTSGYASLAGLAISRSFHVEPGPEPVGSTTSATSPGHPAAATAALLNLDIIASEDLVGRARRLEPAFIRAMGTLRAAPLVADVRAIGLMAAIELDPTALQRRPLLAREIADASLRHGVITRPLGARCLQVSPALVADDADIEAIVDGIGYTLIDLTSAGA